MDKNKIQKNFLIKILCFITAFGVWLYIYNVENPTRSYKLTGVPVEIVNTDTIESSKLTVLPNQDLTVTLTLEGPASEVYRAKAEQFKIVVDLSTYAVKKGSNLIPVEITQYPTNINIKKNESLRVNVEIDEYIEKSVPVKLEVDVTTKDSYYPFEQGVKPDNVLVSGAATYVNSVQWVLAKGSATNADADVSLNLPLKAVDETMKEVKDVKINPTTVDVLIPVRKSKNVTIKVPTKGENNKNIIIKTIEPAPSSIDLVGETQDIGNIEYIETEALDLSTITGNNTVTLKLALPKDAKPVNGKDTVSVKVTVETINQNSVSVPVTITGLSAGLNAEPGSKNISVALKGTDSLLSNIKDGDITATIDLTNLAEGEHSIAPKVKVKEGMTIESISPEKLKITITKVVKPEE